MLHLGAVARSLNTTGGVSTSTYVRQLFANAVLGNSDNAYWSGYGHGKVRRNGQLEVNGPDVGRGARGGVPSQRLWSGASALGAPEMGKVRIDAFMMSLDGYGAGPAQDLQNPLGVGGFDLPQWLFPTRGFKAMHGGGDGETGIDNDFAEAAAAGLGAWILGRNMFGPIRGPWLDDDWRGWWGPNPPYHVPTFVLTHHPRAPLAMEGGTTFHFVTGGAEEALGLAKEVAKGMDVRIGGGVGTVRQYLSGRHVDTMHVAISPALLGAGEPLFAGVDLKALGYEVGDHKMGERAMHYKIAKRP